MTHPTPTEQQDWKKKYEEASQCAGMLIEDTLVVPIHSAIFLTELLLKEREASAYTSGLNAGEARAVEIIGRSRTAHELESGGRGLHEEMARNRAIEDILSPTHPAVTDTEV